MRLPWNAQKVGSMRCSQPPELDRLYLMIQKRPGWNPCRFNKLNSHPQHGILKGKALEREREGSALAVLPFPRHPSLKSPIFRNRS